MIEPWRKHVEAGREGNAWLKKRYIHLWPADHDAAPRVTVAVRAEGEVRCKPCSG